MPLLAAGQGKQLGRRLDGRRNPRGRRLLRCGAGLILATTGALAACGPAEPPPAAPVRRIGPEEQILKIGHVWEARQRDKGFRTAPSPIAMFDTQLLSSLTLKEGESTATEHLVFDERFELRDGTEYVCRTDIELRPRIQYGRRAGRPAIQIDRPAASVPRQCDAPGFVDPVLAVDAYSARFSLSGDQLVGFEPVTEKRVFIPVR